MRSTRLVLAVGLLSGVLAGNAFAQDSVGTAAPGLFELLGKLGELPPYVMSLDDQSLLIADELEDGRTIVLALDRHLAGLPIYVDVGGQQVLLGNFSLQMTPLEAVGAVSATVPVPLENVLTEPLVTDTPLEALIALGMISDGDGLAPWGPWPGIHHYKVGKLRFCYMERENGEWKLVVQWKREDGKVVTIIDTGWRRPDGTPVPALLAEAWEHLPLVLTRLASVLPEQPVLWQERIVEEIWEWLDGGLLQSIGFPEPEPRAVGDPEPITL